VLAVSLESGILVFTYRRQARKIYEIYDRLIFAGIGQQSDVEAVRVAALEFPSKEGFSRSEEDVTIQRVATAMSGPLKKAFSDFSNSPVVARSLFGEVGATPAEDLYYVLDYDGDYTTSRNFAFVNGVSDSAAPDVTKLTDLQGLSSEDAFDALKEIWLDFADPENRDAAVDMRKTLTAEAVLLERSSHRENRFRLLTPEEF
jgi:proteasome alpha subunit